MRHSTQIVAHGFAEILTDILENQPHNIRSWAWIGAEDGG